MDEHKEVKKLVVVTLKTFENTGNPATARQIYEEINQMEPKFGSKHTFKSFCRLIPTMTEIRVVKQTNIQFYKLK